MTDFNLGDLDLHYGGRRVASAGSRMAITAPATGAALGTVPDATIEEVDAAVRAAHEAYRQWRHAAPAERTAVLREMARRLRAHGEELALIDAHDSGGPIADMVKDVEMAAGGLDYFAGLVGEIKGETIPVGPGMLDYTIRQPLGVIGRIVAFNHPMMFAARAAAALAAGNAVVVKPAHQTPLSALRLAEIWADCGPAGLFSVVTGGAATAEALVRHPLVAKVALVGSVATGKAVLRACAEQIKPAALELGGKNALIACADADPAKVAEGAVRGMNFSWAGQSCGSTSRIFVHAAIHDAVVAEIARLVAAIAPGLPHDPATRMGPLVSEAQRDRVAGFIASAHAEGARLVAGGAPPGQAELAGGSYMMPTVFSDVTPAMRIAREEIFGPVMSVLRWDDEAALIEAVNGLDYGLTCAVYTRDLATAHRFAEAVETGYVWINNSSRHFQGAPFGGVKHSGIGREEHLGELHEYTRLKNVNVTFTP
jgi:betaine-aldehyde dehydrogenase